MIPPPTPAGAGQSTHLTPWVFSNSEYFAPSGLGLLTDLNPGLVRPGLVCEALYRVKSMKET